MNSISGNLIKEIKEILEEPLNKAGVFYRIFARSKSADSIARKLKKKADIYSSNGKRLQDIIGIRIIFYFIEDVEIYHKYLKSLPIYMNESNSLEDLQGKQKIETFAPIRLNLIFKMTESQEKQMRDDLIHFTDTEGNIIDTSLIDNTFEVQLRTVLSEGWHEVEHDLRYKCLDEPWWIFCQQESRMINGIYASLETDEHTLESIFSNISYINYKNKNWEPMIRNHFRIRLPQQEIQSDLKEVLSKNVKIAKNIFRFERSKLQTCLFKIAVVYPLNYNNIIFLVNRLTNIESTIKNLEPEMISQKLDQIVKFMGASTG